MKAIIMKWGMKMSRKEHSSVNVMPKGAVEPISDMELVIAKVRHDADQTYLSINTVPNRNEHGEVPR